MKWDVYMKVEGWVLVGSLEAADREAASAALKRGEGDIDEGRADPFEDHLDGPLERAGEFDFEMQ